MEPLSALSLAGTIVQFVDFGTKLLSIGEQIRRSDEGSTVSNQELETTATDLQRLASSIRDRSHLQSIHESLNDDDLAERLLAEEAQHVASELLDMLRKLRSKGVGSSKWHSIRQGFISMRHQDKVAEIERRLDRIRQQLLLRLLVSVRQYTKEHTLQQKSQEAGFGNFVGRFFKHVQDSERWQQDMLKTLQRRTTGSGFAQTGLEDIPKAGPSLRKMNMRLLGFPQQRSREEQITQAMRKTFEWIFRDPTAEHKPWSSFRSWLSSGNGIYWVGGKAGSGKSTLMKFIREHQQTQDLLNAWANEAQLITAAFYFWNSGTKLQMSYEGMLRSLTYDVLQQLPKEMHNISPERCELVRLFGLSAGDWSVQDCLTALKRLTGPQFRCYRFAFFIDGLDEYNGDHEGVVGLLKELGQAPNFKICTSSRPWIVFQDEFSDVPSLSLQDLTLPDIQIYVKENFHMDKKFLKMESYDPEAAQGFCDQITTKAAGVFLWVRLVVHSLLKGIRDGDRMSDLQRRLDSIPEDLYDFFWKILQGIDEHSPDYFEHASQMFHLVKAHEPLDLWTFAFADDPEDIRSLQRRGDTPQSLEARCTWLLESAKRRINSRTRGLLEVTNPAPGNLESLQRAKVQYLHRTVKDFIAEKSVWKKLSAIGFDGSLSIFKAYTLRIELRCPMEFCTFDTLVSTALELAQQAAQTEDDRKGHPLFPALDELNDCLCAWAGQEHSDVVDAQYAEELKGHWDFFHGPMPSLALLPMIPVASHLDKWVKYKLESQPPEVLQKLLSAHDKYWLARFQSSMIDRQRKATANEGRLRVRSGDGKSGRKSPRGSRARKAAQELALDEPTLPELSSGNSADSDTESE